MAALGNLTLVTHQTPVRGAAIVVIGAWSLLGTASIRTVPMLTSSRNVRRLGVPSAGSFSGSVLETGTPVPNCVVRCYERSSGLPAAEVRTDANGLFVIPGMQRLSDDYYVIALDPDGGAVYNALIFDRVVPV